MKPKVGDTYKRVIEGTTDKIKVGEIVEVTEVIYSEFANNYSVRFKNKEGRYLLDNFEKQNYLNKFFSRWF